MTGTLTYPFELVTDRLLIRSPTVEDAPQLREAIAESLDALKPWMPWASHVPTAEEARDNCCRAAQEFREGKDFRLRLFLKESGLFLGGSGLHRCDWSVPKFEIGYWIRRSCSGQGYVTEAVSRITKFAFEGLGAKRVEIRCSARNVKSYRIPERLGFTLEGTLHNYARHIDGSMEDKRVYSKIVNEGV